jgi:DNA-binding CsgD family transcriptional regulator/PAS domain-containing protein
LARYGGIDPRNAHGMTQPAGTIFNDYDFTTEAEMARREFYQDYLLPNGMGYVGARVLKNDRESVAAVAIQRARRQGPFELHELEFLDRLAPHVLRALRLQTRFADLAAQRWADRALRDRLPFAVIVLDKRRRIVELNPAAEQLLAAADGLTVRHGCLRTMHSADQAALDQLIRGAIATVTRTGVNGGGMLALRRGPSLGQPLGVTVMPVPRQSAAPSLAVGARLPAAVVLVNNPESAPAPPEQALRCLYGLTPAEARLAAAFAAGDRLQDYAEAAELSLNYVRWLLKQIQAKTDTRSQVELVRVLAAHAPPLATGG